MRDGGVGEHSFDVGLGDGQHAPRDHRDRRQPPHEGAPVGGQAAEGDVEHAEERRERGHFRSRRHEGGDAGGRSLVRVGGPHVEGHRRHLEGEPRAEEAGSGQGQGGLALGAHLLGDPGQAGGPCGPVGQGHPVEEEGRGERPQQEVLHRGLRRGQPAERESGHEV